MKIIVERDAQTTEHPLFTVALVTSDCYEEPDIVDSWARRDMFVNKMVCVDPDAREASTDWARSLADVVCRLHASSEHVRDTVYVVSVSYGLLEKAWEHMVHAMEGKCARVVALCAQRYTNDTVPGGVESVHSKESGGVGWCATTRIMDEMDGAIGRGRYPMVYNQ